MKANQIIVALDGMDRKQALTTAWHLSSMVWGFKINDLLLEHGLDLVRDLKCLGRVFADVKLYDIPQTVTNSVTRLARAGADFITVHASGGKDMIHAAVESCESSRILAVTALTSMNDAASQEVYHRSIDETVWDLAHLSMEAGAYGIVCASSEVTMLSHLPIAKVVPGIRLEASDDDQVRIGTGKGADYIVVGRPITMSSDPVKALEEIINATDN
jgi:orotidine-5'-phosphate decarboxylase